MFSNTLLHEDETPTRPTVMFFDYCDGIVKGFIKGSIDFFDILSMYQRSGVESA